MPATCRRGCDYRLHIKLIRDRRRFHAAVSRQVLRSPIYQLKLVVCGRMNLLVKGEAVAGYFYGDTALCGALAGKPYR